MRQNCEKNWKVMQSDPSINNPHWKSKNVGTLSDQILVLVAASFVNFYIVNCELYKHTDPQLFENKIRSTLRVQANKYIADFWELNDFKTRYCLEDYVYPVSLKI